MGEKPYPEMRRDEELNMILERYPDVPRTFVLKLDLQRRGVCFTQRATEELQDIKYEHSTNILFQWHQRDKKVNYFPLAFYFNDGTAWGVRLGKPESEPYTVDLVDDNFWLLSDGNPLEEITPLPRPAFYDKKTTKGIPMQYIANAKPSDACIFVPYRLCRYWDTGDQCKFCDLNYNTKLQMKLAREAGIKCSARSSMEDIYETTLEILKEEGRWRHLCITGGSDPRTGYKNEFEYYLNCSKSIQRAFKEFCGIEQIPLYLVLSPYTKEQMRILKEEAGVTRFAPNLEVWDEEKFLLQCPGKAKNLGRDQWIERMLQAVEIFGEGNVECAFVTGVEMAPPPYGYRDVDEAVESAVEGFRFCIFNHIKPVSYNWTIEPGSYFYEIGAKQPPLEFYVRVERQRYMLFKDYERKYNHSFPFGATDYRCCPWSAGVDWERIL